MHYLGVTYDMKHIPELDPGFIPFGVWADAYRKGAEKPLAIAVERDKGHVSVRRTCIHGTPDMAEADYRYVERYVKFLLWSIGGFRVYICGNDPIAARLAKDYAVDGARAFDFDFFHKLYKRDLEVIALPLDKCPEPNEAPVPIGGHMDGCRIGFDAGGSDRKVSAVIDGKCVYSEEVVWHPKTQADPTYHYNEIVEAFRTAASKMPRVDAIGVSSAGTFIGNAPMIASLFIKVPRSRWDEVETIYDRAGAAIGDVPVVVANDGDVTALAGAMSMDVGSIMGIAMGTSEAVGYVDADKNVLGWISELDENLTPAEKLKVVQGLMEQDDPRAQKVFADIGKYLGYTVVEYSHFYDIHYLMVLGRVMSGKGGEAILANCQQVLNDEYPELAKAIRVMLPDEKTRRVGQSVAAASLPELRK